MNVYDMERKPFINKVKISKEMFDTTIEILRKRGMQREEGLVLWGGLINDDWTEARVIKSIVHEAGHWGGGVDLDYQTLIKISDYINARGLVLLAQVHTHPRDFGHSCGDEKTPTSHRYGFISIVVPNYALFDHQDLSKTYVYEYLGNNSWRLLGKDNVATKFCIEKSVIRI